jgi:hypothetical protein
LVISISPMKTYILIGLDNGQLLVVEVKELLEILETTMPGDTLSLPCMQTLKAHHE